jgi:hypothetical protein
MLLITASTSWADDGMWLLALLNKYNAAELKHMGLKIPVEDISGEKDGSLSEAVVTFGSGCTGSIISSQGLILTNYHCSYSAIQQLNNPSRDISNKGYWAKSNGQEMPVSGLSITINKRILDITAEVKTLLSTLTPASIKQASEQVKAKYEKTYPQYRAIIKSYKNNSLFVLFLQVQYNDIRLVGLAPKDVAKFGGETDNWMWPRHSADFAFFRVYGDKNGNPASFNSSNKPLAVKTYLHISTEGYKQGDFTMSMGFPGQSDRNATAAQIKEKINVINPAMIVARQKRQAILEEEMSANDRIRMLYAEKYATSANYYKNAVGMNYWVDKLSIVAKKEAIEQDWINWTATKNTPGDDYKTVLNNIGFSLDQNAAYKRALTYSGECFITVCDMIGYVTGFGKGYENFVEDYKKDPSKKMNFLVNLRNYYRSFDPAVDKRVTKAMMQLVFDSLQASLRPDIFEKKQLLSAKDIDQFVDDVYATSIFADSARLKNWLDNPKGSIQDDPAYQLSGSISAKHMELIHLSGSNGAMLNRSKTLYDISLAEYKDKLYYPDADKTIRLSYGTVSDLRLDDKVLPFQTTLSELVKKSASTNIDYTLNPALAAIWKNKNFGSYGKDGDVPVCFITNGDVTGGNSGSPMMNGEGKLIGLVFDCNWESMTREFNYEKTLHRVICTDIRYVLLLTEKFSGSKRIVDEINLFNPALSAKR